MTTARTAHIQRQTRETSVEIWLNLDGAGEADIHSGVPFLDHLLSHVAVHGLLDLRVQAEGDLEIDEHHTVEDIAIVMGQALDQALGRREGIRRMGEAHVPMDEALAFAAVDLSGRPYAVIEAAFARPAVGALSTEMIPHFLETLATHARMTLHARVLYGSNDHHRAEALFKALGRALRQAVEMDPRRAGIPSTKGVL
jgi:imidazoleglycerol-phosphate dehydratase